MSNEALRYNFKSSKKETEFSTKFPATLSGAGSDDCLPACCQCLIHIYFFPLFWQQTNNLNEVNCRLFRIFYLTLFDYFFHHHPLQPLIIEKILRHVYDGFVWIGGVFIFVSVFFVLFFLSQIYYNFVRYFPQFVTDFLVIAVVRHNKVLVQIWMAGCLDGLLFWVNGRWTGMLSINSNLPCEKNWWKKLGIHQDDGDEQEISKSNFCVHILKYFLHVL